MDYNIVYTVSVLVATVVLVAGEWVRADVVAIGVLAALVVGGQVDTQEALSGFSSTAVISIVALLVLSSGMVRSGVVHWIAVRQQRLAGQSRSRALIASTLPPALLSGVVNIVAAVSILIPAILHLARENRMARSRLLMPMALTSLAGANLTVIGAGHNLVVDSLLRESGGEGLGFFEIMPLGLILVSALLVYSLFFSGKLLPGVDRDESSTDEPHEDLVATYHLDERLWEIWVRQDAPIIGTALKDIGIGRKETRLFASRSRCEKSLGRSALPREGGAWGGGLEGGVGVGRSG